LVKVKQRFSRLRLIWADAGYAGKLISWVLTNCGWVLEIVKRSDDVKGFQVLPRRWVVERTFAWFGRYRRLSKDYETLPETSEAMIYAAMSRLMVRRLAHQA
jgi:putative transposase